MTGLIQRARAEGMERGIERGMERGIEQGMERGIEQGMERGIERGIERGMERGIERGMRQGRAEGGRAVLERLLQQRFGRLSPEAAERLRRAPETELETWADNLLDAGTLDEVFRTTP